MPVSSTPEWYGLARFTVSVLLLRLSLPIIMIIFFYFPIPLFLLLLLLVLVFMIVVTMGVHLPCARLGGENITLDKNLSKIV